jgi:hypothetical protein
VRADSPFSSLQSIPVIRSSLDDCLSLKVAVGAFVGAELAVVRISDSSTTAIQCILVERLIRVGFRKSGTSSGVLNVIWFKR